MPAETAHVPSPHHEPRRPVLQRQTSITQTIRRYCPGHSPEVGVQGPPWVLGLGRSKGLTCLSFLFCYGPPVLGTELLSPHYPSLLPSTFCLSTP